MRIIIIKEYYTYFCLPLYRRYVHRKLQLQIEMQNMPRYIFYSLHVATEKFKCQVKLTYFKALDCKSNFLQHQRWRASIISFQDQVSPPWHNLILKWKFKKKDRLHGIPIDEAVTAARRPNIHAKGRAIASARTFMSSTCSNCIIIIKTIFFESEPE